MLGDTIILSSIPTNPYQELGNYFYIKHRRKIDHKIFSDLIITIIKNYKRVNNNRMSLKIFHNGVKKFTLAPIHYPPNVYASQTSLRVNQTTLRPTKDSWSYDPAVLDLL